MSPDPTANGAARAADSARRPSAAFAGGRDASRGDDPPNPPSTTKAALAEIRSAMADLTSAVGREHERAAHRERIIDRLHEENQRLRNSELQAALDPLRNALYRLYDMVKRESEGTPAAEHVPDLLTAIAEEIAEVIARTGVERLPVEPGDAYDPARHRPAEVAETDDAAKTDTVVAVHRSGFVQGEKVVRRAEVTVAKPAKRVRNAKTSAPDPPEHMESSGTVTEDATAGNP